MVLSMTRVLKKNYFFNNEFVKRGNSILENVHPFQEVKLNSFLSILYGNDIG